MESASMVLRDQDVGYLIETSRVSAAFSDAGCSASVDVHPVDFEHGCFEAARRVVGGAPLVRRRLRPDAKLMPSASDDASPFVFADVFAGRTVVPGGDADLPPLGGLQHDAVVADRIRGHDSVKPRELVPIKS